MVDMRETPHRNLLPAMLVSALLLVTSPVSAQQANTRVLEAGDSRLEVAVIGVDDPTRVAMLQQWLQDVADAPLTVADRFPLRGARVEVRPTDRDDGSPVPWGQTSRDGDVRVLLYVRDDATSQELHDDWTAVHELSHLFHPYLGTRGRWLAEGLASYYQNVLRARIGALDEEEAWRRLDGGFRRGGAARTGERLDSIGRGRGSTMRIYWAGAAYWLDVDLALRRDNHTSLDAVLAQYGRCCLQGTAQVQPQDFVQALDGILAARNGKGAGKATSHEAVFMPLYLHHAAQTTFPSLAANYAELGIQRDGDGLQFSHADAASRLRHAIMHPRKPLVSVTVAPAAGSTVD